MGVVAVVFGGLLGVGLLGGGLLGGGGLCCLHACAFLLAPPCSCTLITLTTLPLQTGGNFTRERLHNQTKIASLWEAGGVTCTTHG